MKNLTLLALGLFVAGATLTGCNKKDENLMTDFNAKKAAADKLITEITTSSATMKTDHQKFMADLDNCAKMPGCDTASANASRQEIRKTEEDMTKVMALVDSVKIYENGPTDNNDNLKATNDRLGANFDDLSSKWKALIDENTKTAADVAKCTSMGGMKPEAGKPEEKTEPAKKTTTTTKTTTTNIPPADNPANHTTPDHTPGVPKHSAGSTTK